GTYTFQWDYATTDESKRFEVRLSKKNAKNRYLMVQLIGKIIGADDENLKERFFLNRTTRTNIMSLKVGDSCSAADWLKSVYPRSKGIAIVNQINNLSNKTEQLKAWKKAIEDALMSDATGRAYLRWVGSYDKGEEYDKAERYARPK